MIVMNARRGSEEFRFLLRYCGVTFLEGLGEATRPKNRDLILGISDCEANALTAAPRVACCRQLKKIENLFSV
jgi:hypothetical protein